MGLTPRGNENLPYEMAPNHFVLKIASGADHIVFLTNYGEVLTCGCAEQGQLGRTTERGSGRYNRASSCSIRGNDQLGTYIMPHLCIYDITISFISFQINC